MNYDINEKVIHPAHGNGLITGVKEAELVDGFHRYYVITYPEKLMTVYIPVGKMEELGFRPVMEKSKQVKVLERLRTEPKVLPENYKIRQDVIRKMLHSNRPLDIANVVRDLTSYRLSKSLTRADQLLLDQARGALASEIALVKDISPPDATQLIDSALEDGLEERKEASVPS